MSWIMKFIQKYPKYCVRCHKYYPGAWKECTTCKKRLVGAEQGWARDWLKKVNYWLIISVVIGAALWGINKTIKDGTLTRVIEREIGTYVKENGPDIIELKNGKKIICKIIGVTARNYYIKNIKGLDEKIDRNMVKSAKTLFSE